MAIQIRGSIVAIKVESTEGTPVSPTAGTDAIRIQDDFTLTPTFETLENAEITASLGPAEPISGQESPTVTFSHYLRHSGTAGQAPNYGDLLQAALGNESVISTERDTVVGSSVSVVNVDTGEGTEFTRGQALLVQHSSNDYEIRPVHSISGDALTLGFDLNNAPGTGVNLGKAVTYYPADSGHQTLTLWHYLNNGGAVQMTSGNRITEVSVSITAGESINASYTAEGLGSYFNPIEITSSDIYLDFTDDQGTAAAVITAKFYKDPHQLADALANAMNAVTTETHTVTYSDSTGKFTIATSTSAVLSLLWNTGTNTANTVGDKIGFSVAADDTGATTYTSDNAQDLTFQFTASVDNTPPLVAKNNELLIGDNDDITCLDGSVITYTLGTPKTDIDSICAESGKSGSVINERTGTVSATILLNQYDADKFKRLRENTTTRFLYVFGTKSGNNWQAGKCGCIYLPTCKVTSFEVADADGLAVINLELQTFVDSSNNTENHISLV